MREHTAALANAQAAAADLAVTLATVRAALGGTQGRAAGNLLEMAELDALSARDAIEKAVREVDFTFPRPQTRVVRSRSGRWLYCGERPRQFPGSRRWWCCHRRLVRRSRRLVIVVGQGELF